MKIKIKYLLIIVLTYIVGLTVCEPYRSYVYEHEFEVTIIADMGANLFSVIFVCHLIWLLNLRIIRNKLIEIAIITIGYITYETISYFFPYFGVFDYLDIIGLLISSIATILIFRITDKKSFDCDLKELKSILMNLHKNIKNFLLIH